MYMYVYVCVCLSVYKYIDRGRDRDDRGNRDRDSLYSERIKKKKKVSDLCTLEEKCRKGEQGERIPPGTQQENQGIRRAMWRCQQVNRAAGGW